MFKNSVRVLLGVTGFLVLALAFLPDSMLGPFGGHRLEDFVSVFLTLSPVMGLVALFVFKAQEQNQVWVWRARFALGLPMIAIFALAVFYRGNVSGIPILFDLLALYLFAAGGASLIATAIWSNWNYRGADVMRSPSHVP